MKKVNHDFSQTVSFVPNTEQGVPMSFIENASSTKGKILIIDDEV